MGDDFRKNEWTGVQFVERHIDARIGLGVRLDNPALSSAELDVESVSQTEGEIREGGVLGVGGVPIPLDPLPNHRTGRWIGRKHLL
jgi:hypothetical protein